VTRPPSEQSILASADVPAHRRQGKHRDRRCLQRTVSWCRRLRSTAYIGPSRRCRASRADAGSSSPSVSTASDMAYPCPCRWVLFRGAVYLWRIIQQEFPRRRRRPCHRRAVPRMLCPFQNSNATRLRSLTTARWRPPSRPEEGCSEALHQARPASRERSEVLGPIWHGWEFLGNPRVLYVSSTPASSSLSAFSVRTIHSLPAAAYCFLRSLALPI